jgi:hypothetical protein
MNNQEEVLVDEFISQLPRSTFSESGTLHVAREFDYIRGRVDIILLNTEGEIIAFEAKLKKWREALHQAYRNTCFAHYSYVVLPENVAKKAIQYEIEFQNRSVGVCYLSNNQIVVAREANKSDPFQGWLMNKARTLLEGSSYETGK